MSSFRDYLTIPSDQLSVIYANLTEEVSGLHQEIAVLCADELRAKSNAWVQHPGSTAEKDRAARYEALELSSEVVKTRAELAAKEEEREFVRWVLDKRYA